MKTESIVFNGIQFRRYPDSPKRNHRVYFGCSSKYRKLGICYYHRELWKSVNGPIPEGYHIHHVDGNPLNNAIDNLDCIPMGKHISEHQRQWTLDNPERRMAAMKAAIAKAPEWHRSEAGREWHKEHAKTSIMVRHQAEFVCKCCGKAFVGDVQLSEFCSKNCISKFRRDSGVDNETRNCGHCGKAFTVNKYAKTRFCSPSCGKLESWKVRKSKDPSMR